MARERNEQLAVLLQEAGWSRAQAANAFNRIAQENNLRDHSHIGRSHVSMWVAGTKPSGAAPVILSQALSRRLGRVITPRDLGFTAPYAPAQEALNWHADPLTTLTELGRTDVDADRRGLLSGAVYSVAALVLPTQTWWETMAGQPPAPPARSQRVGRGDVAAVQELTAAFSRIDQRRGGGHGRKALAQYLRSDVAAFLQGTFPNEQVRRDMFSAAAELAYLSGWMAFDNGEHALAQRYFVLGVKLAARAADAPLTGHILRAMAHQAIDLGFFAQGLDLSTASMQGQRYASASPKERALLGLFTPVPWRPTATNRPRPRPCSKPKTISPRPARASRSRSGRSSSVKPPSPTRPPARCETATTIREPFVSSGAAYALGEMPSGARTR